MAGTVAVGSRVADAERRPEPEAGSLRDLCPVRRRAAKQLVPVAPEIGTPSAFHHLATVARAGNHELAPAVKV